MLQLLHGGLRLGCHRLILLGRLLDERRLRRVLGGKVSGLFRRLPGGGGGGGGGFLARLLARERSTRREGLGGGRQRLLVLGLGLLQGLFLPERPGVVPGR